MTTSVAISAPFTGHLDVDTLAGTASVTVKRHADTPWGPVCLVVATLMLDPAQVLELATELTRAAVPPPPVVVRRITVRRGEDLLWHVECPECFDLQAWHEHGFALHVADTHAQLHASERAA